MDVLRFESERRFPLAGYAGRHPRGRGERVRFLAVMDRKALLALYAEGVTEQEFEYQRLLPEGQELWVSALVHLMEDGANSDVLCLANYRDIHQFKQLKHGHPTPAVAEKD